MKNFTASDRKSLIRLASSLPKGDKSRRAILAGLSKVAGIKVTVGVFDTIGKDVVALRYKATSTDPNIFGPNKLESAIKNEMLSKKKEIESLGADFPSSREFDKEAVFDQRGKEKSSEYILRWNDDQYPSLEEVRKSGILK